MTFPATHNISVIAPLIFKLILNVNHMHNSNPNPESSLFIVETAIYKYLHFAPAQGSILLCNVLRTRPFKYIVYILCDPINGRYSLEKMKRTQRVPKKGAIFVVANGRYFIHDTYSVRYEQPLVKLNRLARQPTGRGGVRWGRVERRWRPSWIFALKLMERDRVTCYWFDSLRKTVC